VGRRVGGKEGRVLGIGRQRKDEPGDLFSEDAVTFLLFLGVYNSIDDERDG